MSGDIEVGDLVIIVKPKQCCGDAQGLGKIFRVIKIKHQAAGARCVRCKSVRPSMTIAMRGVKHGAEMSRIKKLPDLSEPVSTDTPAAVPTNREKVME